MHPDSGDIRAYLDGEAPEHGAALVREHLESCVRCRSLREEILANGSLVGDALGKMVGRPDLAEARRALRRRLGTEERGSPKEPAFLGSFGLFRAAAVAALLLGGISAALPGSPVRDWITRVWEGESAAYPEAGSGPGEPGGGSSLSSLDDGSAGEGAAVRVLPREGSVRVELTGAAPGTRVRIVLGDGERAGISSDGASRFRSGTGFIEVAEPSGLVAVELPRTVASAEVYADGRLIFAKDGQALSFPTLTPQSDGEGFVLTLPGPPGGDGG